MMQKMQKKNSPPSHHERYRRLFETTHLGIIILDCKTRKITDVNPFTTKLLGCPAKDLVGKTFSQARLFDNKISAKQLMSDLEKDEDAFYENVTFYSKNGQRKIADIGAHTYEELGRIMVQCTVRDHTEKRKAQQELFETNQRLEALMNALPVGVSFSLDASSEKIIGNPYLLHKMEIRPEDNISISTKDKSAIGKKLRHFMNGRELTSKEMPIQRAISEKREVGPFEIEIELPSGKRWLVESHAAPIHDKSGNVIGAVAVNIDLTERKKAEEAERLARIIEQEKLKMDFIADATHELRTPLAIIRGNVELSLHTKSSPIEALKAINVEVLHLTNILSDLALLTTKESDVRRKISTRKVEISSLITRVAKRHESFAQEKNISLNVEQFPRTFIIGDEHYLERLFSNLIANAIRYGKKDGAAWMSGRKGAGSIDIRISDNGIGISAKDLPHIFDRFYRSENSRSKDTGGSGLGLAIVRWIAEAHGGHVTATSKIGEGSTFMVTLPLPRPSNK